MQELTKNKLNGHSFKAFDEIGINSGLLYRLKYQKLSEKEILSKAFKHKFGKGASRVDLIMDHYTVKILRIKRTHLMHRGDSLKKIKNDIYKTGELFNINESQIDGCWDSLMRHYIN